MLFAWMISPKKIMSNTRIVTVRSLRACRLFLDATWNTCIICEMCVEQFLTNMMSIYKKNLLEADCRASQLRVLAQGPPIYVAVYYKSLERIIS